MKFPFFLLLCFLEIGLNAQTTFHHTSTVTNIRGNATIIDNALLNGKESAIIFIMPVWDSNTESYRCNNYALNAGVRFDKTTQRWSIVNQDPGITMSPNQTFNVLAFPKEQANCFSVVCRSDNRTGNGHGMVVDHPSSNNDPSALILVTQNYQGAYNNNSQLVYYHNGKWHIANDNYFSPVCDGNKSFMPFNAKFNVLVLQKDKVSIPDYSNASAFLHKTTHIPPAANIEYINQHVSHFSAPENNGFNTDPKALIFATANLGWAESDRPTWAPIGNLYTDSPLAIWQTRTRNQWAIVNANAAPLKEGILINVLAVY